jgi:hypothetical protein
VTRDEELRLKSAKNIRAYNSTAPAKAALGRALCAQTHTPALGEREITRIAEKHLSRR